MRRYDVVSGILLILSIIDFALAAPVLVQVNHQACVNVVHIPKDVINVLGKRGVDSDDLKKLLEEYVMTLWKPVDSSAAHASSSSAPLEPDHGLTNVVQPPVPNPASSTAIPDPLMEPSSPSSTAPKQGDDGLHKPLYTPTLTEHGSDHDLTAAHAPQPNPNKRPWADSDPDPDVDWNHWVKLEDPPLKIPALPKEFSQAHEYQVEQVQQPNPKKRPSTGADPDFDRNYGMNLDGPPPLRSTLPKEFGQVYEYQAEHVQQLIESNPGLLTDPVFDWISLDDMLPRPALAPKEASPARWGIPSWSDDASNPRLTTESDSDHNLMAPPYPQSGLDKDHYANPPSHYVPSQTEFYSYPYYPGSVAHPPSPSAGLPTVPGHEGAHPPYPGAGSPNLWSLKGPENEVVHGPSTSAELTDPQSLNAADSQPADLIAAAIYAAKGKAKESRRVSGSSRDVGNAAQKESQPAKRSLDPGI